MSSAKREYLNLIPETRARLVASGIPYAIENVEGAPLGESGYLVMLCGTMFGLETADARAELRRHRHFETSFWIPLRPACQHAFRSVMTVAGDHPRSGSEFTDRAAAKAVISVLGNGPEDGRGRLARNRKRAITVTGSTAQTNTVRNRDRETFSVEDAKHAMEIDWMTMKGLSQAIPPVYSEFIGRQVIESLR